MLSIYIISFLNINLLQYKATEYFFVFGRGSPDKKIFKLWLIIAKRYITI